MFIIATKLTEDWKYSGESPSNSRIRSSSFFSLWYTFNGTGPAEEETFEDF